MAQLCPSAGIIALARAGVRLHAQYVHDRAGVVAMETCSPASLSPDYAPVLRDLAPGVRITVCGPDGRVLPRGVDGELVIEVPADTWGRDHAPARSATGDLGRLDQSGAVRYLGAVEATVRWAGLTLNIPSLERYLAAHPSVGEAVVVARGSRLAAYVRPRPGTDLDVRQVRLHLRRRTVPREMRLSRVTVVPALPHREDGEVDRSAVAAGEGWIAVPHPEGARR
jgi:acyl-coenzyme A synthetase/AMP-(fatty) acid ligase